LAVVILSLLVPASALASDTHYNDLLFGTRSFGFGGAFTALSGDPSGLWYNPGGLVGARRPNIQITTSLYGIESVDLRNSVGEATRSSSDKELGSSDIGLNPALTGGIVGLGDRRADKTYNHAVAFVVISPDWRFVRQQQSIADPTLNVSFDREFEDSTLWAGVGYAGRISEVVSLGLSVFWVGRDIFKRDVIRGVRPSNENFFQRSSELNVSSSNLMAMIGAQFKVHPQLNIGLSLGSPGIALGTETTLHATTSAGGDFATGGTATVTRHEFSEERSDSEIPLVVRLGASWVLPKRLTVSADLSLRAPISYTHLTPTAENSPFLTRPTVIDREVTFNAALGVEVLIIEKLSIATGFYTNLSSAAAIEESPSSDQLADIDMYGATLVVGYFLEHSLLRVGAGFAYGTGHDVVANDKPGQPGIRGDGWSRTDVSRWSLQIFIGSTFRY
jgi:hypothetical protein